MPRRFLPILVVCLTAAPASAHIGAVGAADASFRGVGLGAFALEEPWGLVLGEAQTGARWVCHELLSSPGVAVRPDFVIAPDGAMLAMTGLLAGSVLAGESLYVSDDGCDWRPAGGMTDSLAAAAAFHPLDGALALVGTANYAVGAVQNELMLSTDGGATFSVQESFADLLFRSVGFGADGSAYAIAITEEPPAAHLLRSADGGAPWAVTELDSTPAESPFFPQLMGIDSSDSDRLWVLFDGTSGDLLLRSEDGGASFVAVQSAPDAVVDLIPGPDGDAWLTSGDRELWYAPDGSAFAVVPSPAVWGGARDGGQLLLATDGSREVAAAVYGQSPAFEVVVDTLDLAGPLLCPDDSAVATVCAPLWDDLMAELARTGPMGSDDDDSAPGDDDDVIEPCGGCSSDAGRRGPGGLALLGLVAGVLLRRRR